TDSLAGEAVYLSGDDGDGLLEAGEIWTYEALYTVQPDDPDPLVNIATATGQDLDGDFVTGEASHSLSSSADISIEKSDSPDPVHVGAELTYSVILANHGPSEAISIHVVDALPSNLLAPEISFDTTSWESWDGILSFPSLGVNETMRFLVRGTASASGVLTNVIEVRAETPDPDMSNNRATELTTVVMLADLEIRKTDSADPVSSGEIFEYRIEVRNNGPDTAREVTVRETMPTSIVWLGYETTTGSYDPIYGVWTVGDLEVGETASLTFTVRSNPIFEGVLVNQVDVSSQTPDPVSSNNSSIERTSIVGSAGGGGGALLPCERLVPDTDRIWFRTDYAMYCASEFERLVGLADSSAHRIDTLLPTWVRTTKERGQIVAFDNVIQVNVASGLGIEMSTTALHSREGSWESRLQGYAEMVGLPIEERPLDERWIMLEYVGGDPRFISREDDLWPVGDWAVVDQRIAPSALGMGLLGQVQEAGALLENGSPLEQYLALALTDVMAAKLVLLDEQMALPLSGGDLRYFAESYYARSEPGGMDLKINPIRPEAQLFDHVALLMGLTAFVEYSDPSSSEIFGDGLLFAPEYHELATGLQSEVLSAIEVLFTDADGQVWSEVVPDSVQRFKRLTTDLGLLLASLADVARSGDSGVKEKTLSLLVRYADHLLEEQEDSGAIRSDLSRESSAHDTWELGAQAAAIRGFVATSEETGDSRYLRAAEACASFVDEFLWDEGLGVYAGALLFNRKEYCYSSLDVGLVMGALRSLAVAAPRLAGDLLEKAGRFFRAIVDEADLQLPEDVSTGTFGEFSGSGAGRISGLQIANAPLGVAPVLQERFCLEQDSEGEPCCGIDVAREPWYQTDIAMYASFEMQDVAPWAEDYADANLA
ncbi:MAG: hypothetical protein V3T03_07895, partial [Candidatus Bipolaricaulota bacterium]